MGENRYEGERCTLWEGFPTAAEVESRVRDYPVTGVLMLTTLYLLMPVERTKSYLGAFEYALMVGELRKRVVLQGSYDGSWVRISTPLNSDSERDAIARRRNELVDLHTGVADFYQAIVVGQARPAAKLRFTPRLVSPPMQVARKV